MHMCGRRFLCGILSLVLTMTMFLTVVLPVTANAQEISKEEIQNKMLEILYQADEDGKLTCDFDGYVALRPYRHEGIDFAVGAGHDVYALINGVVTNAGGDRLNTIAIYDETNDKTVVYLHTRSADVDLKVGDTVQVGQVIAKESSAGACAVHTHVEVRNGKQTNAAVSSDTVLVNEDPYAYWRTVLFEQQKEPMRQNLTILSLCHNETEY